MEARQRYKEALIEILNSSGIPVRIKLIAFQALRPPRGNRSKEIIYLDKKYSSITELADHLKLSRTRVSNALNRGEKVNGHFVSYFRDY